MRIIMPKKKTEPQEEKKPKTVRRSKKQESEEKKEFASEETKKIEPLSWRAAEYERVQKPASWYTLIGGGAIVVAIIAFWSGNLFFGIFILCAAGLLMFLSGRHPQILEFEISDAGVEIKDKMKLPFESLRDFSIRSRQYSLDELILRKKTNINPYVRIPIDSALAEKARVLLRGKISEVEYEESIIDLLSDRFGL